MTLKQMRFFLAAMEQGTLTRAAEAMGVSQSNFSEQVIRLEEALGATLFIRTNRALELTEAGRNFAPHARASLEALQQGERAVQDLRGLAGGIASFGTFGSAHHYFLRALIRDFRQAYPGMRLRLVGNNSAEVAHDVSEGRLEAGLVMLPVQERNLIVSEPVWSTPVGYLSVVPARAQAPKTILDLARAPLIMTEARWGRGDPVRRILNERARAAGVALHPLVEVEHQITGLELARDGIGDVLATRPIVHHLGFGDSLHWVPLEPPIFETFAFIQNRDVTLSPATRALKELLRQHLARIQTRYQDL
ncbi:LysR family transcriptional regulator [Pseudooceanicola sp. GBMRC 2024]|uniref:LysR family transcriptional regulator n=1 Tax=Pseudooceanicola albus TaxID=2692189 RepID=A0A6L7G490_9RHOB|nr:LysR family transcriptional regulator [Pseudooceanicola albus]